MALFQPLPNDLAAEADMGMCLSSSSFLAGGVKSACSV
jgi:hypothetical protein